MKKVLISVVTALCCFAAATSAFAGCGQDKDSGADKTAELQTKIEELQKELNEYKSQAGELKTELDETKTQTDKLQEENEKLKDLREGYIKQNDVTENGEFFTVQEAFDLGLLKHADLLNIVYYRGEENPLYNELNKDKFDENYVPAPKSPEKLSLETEYSIKKAYRDKYIYDDVTKFKDMGVVYYGTYNDCVAVRVLIDNSACFDVEIDNVVDGIHFWYPCLNTLHINTMLIWKKI